MTHKSGEKPKGDGNGGTKVVVFGCDNDGRPHAGWFPKGEADRARAAAKQLRFNCIHVANGPASDLVGKLPPGRIHANGPGVVPPVREDLYEKVVATLNQRGEANRGSGEAVATDWPDKWDAIKAGHVVLYHESLADGWWEAVVVTRAGDNLTLRTRDYPGYPNFVVRATDVALINPKIA